MRHRLVPVLVVVQLLSIASDHQQGIVHARTEDEDAQDACALAVDGEVGVFGQQVDDTLRREHSSHDSHDQEQDGELEAAVGDQEDDEHDPDSREQ